MNCKKSFVECLKSRVFPNLYPFLIPPNDYIEICKLAAAHQRMFKIFKRQPGYRRVLEHVNKKQGDEYLKIIKFYGNDNIIPQLEKYHENDSVGNPIIYHYKYGDFSPTTLRYIKVLTDLYNFYGSLDNFNIIEVGCAYGGQCKIIHDTYELQKYTVIDLSDILLLTKKYLKYFNIPNIVFTPANQVITNICGDLSISNYAFSELNKVEQNLYIQHIFKNVKRGYITYNAEHMIAHNYQEKTYPEIPYTNKEIINILSRRHNVYAFKEIPNTAKKNIIIAWGMSKQFINSRLIDKKYYQKIDIN